MENISRKSPFTKIYEGELPWVILCSTRNVFSLLSHRPAMPGHILLVPKREVATFMDLTLEEMKEFDFLRYLFSKSLLEIFPSKKIWQMVSGFEVNHYHEHLIPANNGKEISLQNTSEASLQERQEMGNKIIKILGLFLPEAQSKLSYRKALDF